MMFITKHHYYCEWYMQLDIKTFSTSGTTTKPYKVMCTMLAF